MTQQSSFLGEQYLLGSETAKRLYEHIRDLPIVDAHNHADIVEIVEDRPWSDIWVIQGATDHYVWELMRKRGVPEEKVTGNASNWEKWEALASIMPELIGNPVYEWVHLDLQRRFGIHDLVSKETAETIWNETSAALRESSMRPQAVLKAMKVEVMGTTDNPTLSLPYHERAKKEIQQTSILPTWRPDKVMNIDKGSWHEAVKSLGEETGDDVASLQGLLSALKKTHDYFAEVGCVASDHGVQEPYSHEVSEGRAQEIHRKAFRGESLNQQEILDYKAFLMIQFGEMNAETGWVTQFHIGPVRDYRDTLYHKIGLDSGGDISTQNIHYVENLHYFFNRFDDKLPIVLYCVDPTHLPTLATIARAFPNISVGAPWWWNDSPYGIEDHLRYVATVDLLANHAGMVTDSRKLLSFGSRTEMFRRTLSTVLGDLVEKGQAPEEHATQMAAWLAHRRQKELFLGRAS